jgi:hypothetical protein
MGVYWTIDVVSGKKRPARLSRPALLVKKDYYAK